jgi:hypothetical protein
MMMPFYCSYRNKNEPSAIYPSFGYSPRCEERRILRCASRTLSTSSLCKVQDLISKSTSWQVQWARDTCAGWQKRGKCALMLTYSGCRVVRF